MGNFYQDTIKGDKRFKTTKPVHDLDMLEPVTRAAVESIIAEAAVHGIKLMPFETYRSRERQMALFDQGASKLKNVGVHHYGLACDLVKDVGGQPSWKGDFSLVGDLAKSHRLIWGGDWGTPLAKHSFIDAVHVQRCSIKRQASLFHESWYPDGSYNPYDDL